jgi:hypothetical protein
MTPKSITSATDGNKKPVENGGTTDSTYIRFNFTGSGVNSVPSFECKLYLNKTEPNEQHIKDHPLSKSSRLNETKPIIERNSSCVTTIAYNSTVIHAGQQYIFAVRPVDTQGNKEPHNATLIWTVLTPPQQKIQNLINTIDSIHLSRDVTINLALSIKCCYKRIGSK